MSNLQLGFKGDVLVPVDSHFPVEKFKAITDGYDADDKRAVADARAKLATAFKAKAKSVNEKYIVPPKTTDFAIVYAPTESLYKELTEYQDPSTKELLTQELMKKHKVVICGPNTLSAYLQSLHMGFQSLKVQKGATEIYNHLKTISSRFGKHFENIISLRKKLEEAMSVVDKFGTDARSITRTLERANLKTEIQNLKDTLNNTINTSLGSMSTSFNNLSTGVTKDMTEALTKVDEKVGNFNQQVQLLNQSQEGITKILAGVKKYGTLAEFSLDALIKDLLPASQFMTNVKMKEDTSENVEFAIRLQGDVLVPVDSHFPVEKFKAITDGYDADDKRAVADARAKLATAFKAKAKSVNEKYIVPPKTTDFAIVYAPTESLYKELTEYQDPSTKELLTQELMKKHKVVICGPNTLSAYLQSLHMGFQSLKVQKGATEIYNHLKTISSRFGKHFENIISLRKKLEEAMSVVDKFGTDARSITRTLESIKDPEQLEKAVQTENVEKFVDHSKQAKN